MTLKDWLAEEGLSPAQFAQTISRSGEAVRRYTTGDRIPDKETMGLIVSATGGRVTPNDFFGVIAEPKAA